MAEPYWPKFAANIVSAWSFLFTSEQAEFYHGAAYRSGFFNDGREDDLSTTLQSLAFTPSGKRTVEIVVTRVAAGLQPRGRALPQLIPDLLGPEPHLAVS